ncbi:hypothetical protein RB628_40610 [Streptomyces sp. ADMS]|uniref:hypothetical protein n=1 Tax=Streptomyces sp. ADMS TaxID=3071415 RepID=UPI00296E57EA|nr:hypothetical protein [Streptomyces sp. ADMS]MDW4911422.1 hypothetical protein [Streptomyces sp. ADMS]
MPQIRDSEGSRAHTAPGVRSTGPLIELGREGRRRVRVADELGIDTDLVAIDQRLLILLEEVSATMRQRTGVRGVHRGLCRSNGRTYVVHAGGAGAWAATPSPLGVALLQ